jgi:hypothetical protein
MPSVSPPDGPSVTLFEKRKVGVAHFSVLTTLLSSEPRTFYHIVKFAARFFASLVVSQPGSRFAYALAPLSLQLL